MTRLEKYSEELERARKRLAEQTKRVQSLEERYKQEENLAIQNMVREANLTPAQLGDLIRKASADNPVIHRNEDDSFTGNAENVDEALPDELSEEPGIYYSVDGEDSWGQDSGFGGMQEDNG